MNQSNTKKLAIAGILCAVAVVGSLFTFPVLASKCAPIQHMVNVLCAVLLGPWYGVGVAFGASLIRNLLGLGTIMAFPGSMCGALLCGLVFWKTRNLPATLVGGGLRHRHHRRPGRLSRGHPVYRCRRRHGGFLRLHRPLPHLHCGRRHSGRHPGPPRGGRGGLSPPRPAAGGPPLLLPPAGGGGGVFVFPPRGGGGATRREGGVFSKDTPRTRAPPPAGGPPLDPPVSRQPDTGGCEGLRAPELPPGGWETALFQRLEGCSLPSSETPCTGTGPCSRPGASGACPWSFPAGESGVFLSPPFWPGRGSVPGSTPGDHRGPGLCRHVLRRGPRPGAGGRPLPGRDHRPQQGGPGPAAG